MPKSPDDDLPLDGIDNEAPAAGGAPPPAPKASPWGPPVVVVPSASARATKTDTNPPSGAFVPLRRQRPDEDDLDNEGPSLLRKSSSSVGEFLSGNKGILLILVGINAMIAGVYGGYRHFSHSSSSADMNSDTATEAVPQAQRAEAEQKEPHPFIGPAYPGNDAGDIKINCGLNFSPPNRYTVACDGRFNGNPELRFDNETGGNIRNEYHDGTIYVESSGRRYSCPVAISRLEGSRSEIHSAVFGGIGCMPSARQE